MNKENYMQVVKGSEKCLNGHKVFERTEDGTPWKCAETGCKYAVKPSTKEGGIVSKNFSICSVEDCGIKILKNTSLCPVHRALQERGNHLDNDKEELLRRIKFKALHHTMPASIHSDDPTATGNIDHFMYEVSQVIDQYTQSKLKAFAGEVEKAIGEDYKAELYDIETKEYCSKKQLDRNRIGAFQNLVRKQLRESLKAIKEKYQL